MEYALIVIACATVVMFWGFLKRILNVTEQMSLRGLNKLNDEQKKSTVDWYKSNSISESDAAEVVASKATFESLNI